MQAARALSRMSAVAAPLRQTGQQLRRMGGGHGHGHGPKKTVRGGRVQARGYSPVPPRRRFTAALATDPASRPRLQLPPKPATLKDNATLGEKIEYALWDKRHPDYEGVESYVRFYLPGNHQVRVEAALSGGAGLTGAAGCGCWSLPSGVRRGAAGASAAAGCGKVTPNDRARSRSRSPGSGRSGDTSECAAAASGGAHQRQPPSVGGMPL
jgi:hypothetical protein